MISYVTGNEATREDNFFPMSPLLTRLISMCVQCDMGFHDRKSINHKALNKELEKVLFTVVRS